MVEINAIKLKKVEMMGIDPIASRMLSKRSTIWATPPTWYNKFIKINKWNDFIILQNSITAIVSFPLPQHTFQRFQEFD